MAKPAAKLEAKNEVPSGSRETAAEVEDKSSYMPGQKHATPEDGDSLRIFYETLRQQRPESKLAEKWILEHGLCESREKALQL